MPVIDDEKLKQALATLAGRTAEQFAEGIAMGAGALRALSELATGKPQAGGLAPFLEQLPERTARAFGLTPYEQASEREKAIANLIAFLPEILAAGGGAAALGMAKMKGGSLPLGKPQSWIEFARRWGETEKTGALQRPEEYSKWAERLKKEGFIHFKPTGTSGEEVFGAPEEFIKGLGYYKQEASPLSDYPSYIQPLGARLFMHPYPTGIGPRELATVTEFARPGSEAITEQGIVAISEKLRDLLSRKEIKSFHYWLGEDVGKAMEITQRIADRIAKGAPKKAIAEEQKRLAELLGIDPSKDFGRKVVEKLQNILADRFYPITVVQRRIQLFSPLEGAIDWPSGLEHIQYSAFPGLSTEVGTILSNYYQSIGRGRLEPLQVMENVYVVREKDLARWAAKRPGPTRAALALMSATDEWAYEPYGALSRIPYSPEEGTGRPIKTPRATVIPRQIREFFPETRGPRHYPRLTPPGSAQLAFSEFHPSAALVMRPVNEWPIPDEEAREFLAKWQRPDKINVLSQEGKTPFLAVSEVQSDIEQNPELRRQIVVGHTKLIQDSTEFWQAAEKANRAWERFFATVESLPDSKAVLSLFEGGPFDLARVKKDPLGFLGTLMFYTSDVPEANFYRRGTEITVNDVAEALIQSLLGSKPGDYPRAGEKLLDIFRRIQVPKTQLLTYFGDPLTPEIAPDLNAAVKMMILSLFNLWTENHPLEGYIRFVDLIAKKALTSERSQIRPKIQFVADFGWEALKAYGPELSPQGANILFNWPYLATEDMEFIGARARDMMAMTPSNEEKARQLKEMIQESRGILRKLHETAKKVFNAEYRPWGLDYRDFVIRHAFTTAYYLEVPYVGFASGSVPARRWVAATVPFGSGVLINHGPEQTFRRFNIQANGQPSRASRSLLRRVMPRIENGERDFSVVLNDFRDFISIGHASAAYDVLYDDLLLDRVRALLRYHSGAPVVIQGAIGLTNIGRAPKEGGYYLVPVQELAPIMQYASANDTVIEEPTAVA
jgi:hypothetical protein